MDLRLFRAYMVELVGTFAFVFIASGLTCVNVMTTPKDVTVGTTAVTVHQPGLVGVALGQALVWLAMVAWSAPVSGGYLNPAITLVRWVFGQISSVRMAWFIGAQLVGGVLAGLMLMAIFDRDVLQAANFGVPVLNRAVFPPDAASQQALWAGLGIEVLLTFLFVLAMYSRVAKSPAPWLAAAVLAGAALFAGPITGAALNPVRWFGPAFWQTLQAGSGSAARPALVYVAGPIVGALLAGAFVNRVYEPALKEEL